MSRDGLVILDKESGVTSHQVVGRTRRLLGIRKIGHAGTLDPMATGVLLLGVGRATRMLGHLALHDKRYLATIRLGQSSTTDDADGMLSEITAVGASTASQIAEAVATFRGDIQQIPSTVSAIKVGGQRAYARARRGETVALRPRSVTISRFDVLDIRTCGQMLDVDVDVECSSGTYIRALARDLGALLGVGGHLTQLRRTRIGNYDISDAQRLGEEPPALMTMTQAAARSFPLHPLDAVQSRDVRFGRSLALDLEGLTGLCSPAGQLLALYAPKSGMARPVTVFVGPEDEIEGMES